MNRFSVMLLLVLTAVLGVAGSASAQFSLSLPNGFLNADANNSTAYPFNDNNSHKWQWHYDSTQFAASGPILITEMYIRTVNGTTALGAFSFPSVVITMASSPTNYTLTQLGPLPPHSTTFAANLNPDATVVRTGPWIGGPVPASGGAAATWVPLGLTGTFLYDPTLGNDFVIQIEKCGSTIAWTAGIDGPLVSGVGTVGGNRYGIYTACVSTVSTFSNNEFVPVVKLDYLTDNRLSITQSGPGVGDLTVTLTNITAGASEGWTLVSGDTSAAAGSGPFIGIRPDGTTWLVLLNIPVADGNPFHFPIPSAYGLFPNTPFAAGPGAVTSLTGQTLDFATLVVSPGPFYAGRSNVVRFTFQ